jgi:UDP-N-acetylglucosamine 2-epimerase (non-hydrolysing)
VKVLSVVGARPQFVKLAPMARAITAAGHEHVIVHTGQHYDVNMSDVFFEQLRIPTPDVHLGVGSGSHGVQTGAILGALDAVLTERDPDWVLVYGDTNSTIAGALSAVKLRLPLAHLEAGLRSFNRAMPEEHNRVLTDHAADLCLAPTQTAFDHLEAEGLASRSVVTGDVMTDVCLATAASVGEGLPSDWQGHGGQPYVLATIHRAENTDDPARLGDILKSLSELPVPVVLAAHPRLLARCDDFGLTAQVGAVQVIEPLDYPGMVSALKGAQAVVTDSGGLQKEAFILGTPCTTVRTETEWIETLESGWNVLCPDPFELDQVVLRETPPPSTDQPYGDGRSARRVVEILQERLPS